MKNQPVKRSQNSLLWVLSAVVAITLLVFIWSPWQKVYPPEVLLERYLDPAAIALPILPPGDPAPGSEEQIRKTFFDNYRAFDYQDALSAARGLTAPTTTDSVFMALAYLGNEQSDVALDLLLKLEGSNSTYQLEIKWFTALVNWKSGDLDAGINQLKSYRLGDRYYSEARKFLRAIKE